MPAEGLEVDSAMRVISGIARGMPLLIPKGPPIRPTPNRVKEAIFSSLGERVVGARVLDLFAGTGALGLEAASRGAQRAVLVDASRYAVEATKANAAKTRLSPCVEVKRIEVFRFLERLALQGQQFDLIVADPPYEKSQRPETSLARKLLNCPALVSILARDGTLVLEHFKSDPAEATGDWELQRQLRHGDTVVSFFTHAPRTRTTSTITGSS